MFADACIHIYPHFPRAPKDLCTCGHMFEVLRRDGIGHAIVLEDVDPAVEHLPEFFLRMEMARRDLRSLVGRKFASIQILHSGIIPLQSASVAVPYFPLLTLGLEKLLPICIPGGVFSAREEMAYGSLLHHGITPLLVRCEEAFLFASEESLKRLLSLPRAVFLLSRKAFFQEALFPVLDRLLALHRNVILGSDASDAASCGRDPGHIPSSHGRGLYAVANRFSDAYLAHGVFD